MKTNVQRPKRVTSLSLNYTQKIGVKKVKKKNIIDNNKQLYWCDLFGTRFVLTCFGLNWTLSPGGRRREVHAKYGGIIKGYITRGEVRVKQNRELCRRSEPASPSSFTLPLRVHIPVPEF